MKLLSRFLLSALWLVLASACRHPLEIVGEGDILSASGARDCTLEAFQSADPTCTGNEVGGAYRETYTAAPRAGWQFNGWGPYCRTRGNAPPRCRFDIPADLVAEYGDGDWPPLTAYFRRQVTAGHDALLMGHSFFAPFAAALPEYAAWAGFPDHRQERVFAGGADGAPISFWESTGDDNARIKARLDAGGITLFGMTHYPLGYERSLEGIINWVDYALVENPDVVFFIGMPWPTDPGSKSLEQYRSEYDTFHEQEIHGFIDELRQRYPDNQFYCIPYGKGAVELKRRFEEGRLPEITQLISDREPAVFIDSMGHAREILTELGSLIWLRAIYGVDLDEFSYTSSFDVDLAAIAERVMDRHDHRYDAR